MKNEFSEIWAFAIGIGIGFTAGTAFGAWLGILAGLFLNIK